MKPMMDSEQRMTIAAQLESLRRAEFNRLMTGRMLDMFDNAPDAYRDLTPSYDLSPRLDEVDAKICGVGRIKAVAVGVIAFFVFLTVAALAR